MSNTNHLLIRLMAMLLAALALAGAAAAQTQPPVPVHVMTFRLDDATGVLEPQYWRSADWPNLKYATEEQLNATIAETDEMRFDTGYGDLAVRGIARSGKIVYRGIARVQLWDIQETVDASGKPALSRLPIPNPIFIVTVPQEASLVTFEGWRPASHSSFSLEQIAARFKRPRNAIRAEDVTTEQAPIQYCATPAATLIPGRINILVLSDAYRRTGALDETALFNRHTDAALQRMFATSPWDRYRTYFADQRVFIASRDAGAIHPLCTDHSLVDPAEPTAPGHSTAFGSTFCSGAPAVQRLLTINAAAVTSAISQCVTGTPEIVLIMVNDSFYGGSGGDRAVASADPLSSFIAVHEIGHSFLKLKDEYDGSVGVNNGCSDSIAGGTPCAVNITNITTSPKWQRWINGTANICPNNHSAATPQTPDRPQTCTFHGIGLYEGAFGMNTGWYRPDLDCLMRSLPASLNAITPFCSICKEQHVRTFYGAVNPVVRIEHEEIRDTIQRNPAFPSADVHAGGSIILGEQVLGINLDPDWQFTWYVNGQVQTGQLNPYFTFSPASPATWHVEVEREDATPMVRADQAHPKPHGMKERIGWNVVSDAAASATTSGTTTVSQSSPVLNATKGTQTVNLTYTLNTAEPGGSGRPGDFWTVDVKYAGGAGISALSTAAIPFHDEGTITSVSQNKTYIVPVRINSTAADVQVVAVVTVKNLETADFVPTTISASLTATPVACGTSCDYCAANPLDPTCPINFSIDSANILPLPASQPNLGDSTLFSLGERLDDGRHAIVKMTTPSVFSTLHVIVDVLKWDGTPLMKVRDVTWQASANDYRGGVQGLERDTHDLTSWDLNISPKKAFPDVLNFPTLTEDQWVTDIKYRITAEIRMPDGRAELSTYDITHINSPSKPSANDTALRPLRALWHTTHATARWHFWSSVAMNNWLRANASLLHTPDRVADEYAVDDTPPGHEFGTGVTEVPFYPGAARYDFFNNDAYDHFRQTANAALNGAPVTGQAAARDVLVTWINATRNHLAALAANADVSEVQTGDGSLCGASLKSGDRLPEEWLRKLLQTGKILDANGQIILDLTDRVAATWTLPPDRVFYGCTHNYDINVLVDRCRIDDLNAAACVPGRHTLIRTSITTQPQSWTVNSGAPATLSVIAVGSNLHYQWYVGNSSNYAQPVANATGATLQVAPDATTAYWVFVSGALGDATSVTATVTVNGSAGGPCNSAPVINTQPPAQIVTLPTNGAVIGVSASGENLHYQWYIRDLDGAGIPIAGATLSNYVSYNLGWYFVRISNACGTVESSYTTIVFGTTCGSPAVRSMTASQTSITAGQSITLSADVSGNQPVSIVWYQHTPNGTWVTIGSTAQVTVTPPEDLTEYFISAGNECGSMISSQSLVIHLCTPPVITQQPAAPPRFSNFGQSALLSVVATGSDLHYEWSLSGSAINHDAPDLLVGAPAASVFVSVRVYNDCGSVDSTSITIDPPCSPPVFQTQPRDGSVGPGQPITLTAGALGSPVPSYQWYVKAPGDAAFAAIPNAVSASVAVSPAVDLTQYKVVATNACGMAESDIVSIAVTTGCIAPHITTDPISQAISYGDSVTLNVSATGTGVSFQWYAIDGTPLSGQTASSLTVTLLQTASYYAVASSSCGSAQSAVATVTVNCVVPAITTHPQSQTLTVGQVVLISVNASGALLHFQWYEQRPADAMPLAIFGADSNALTVGGSSTPSGTKYTCRVFNGCGSVTSDEAVVSFQ